MGRCPNCQEWNTFVETQLSPADTTIVSSSLNPPAELSRIDDVNRGRFALPMEEFSRVLGGGVVSGSLALIGGDPGIGKSTLLLQAAAMVASEKEAVVYVSGEETPQQIKIRADRLGLKGNNLYLLAENDLKVILGQIIELSPRLVVIDSIQTVSLSEIEAAPGSITQIRECTLMLMRWAKQNSISVFIIGHVTKDGAIAGPKAMEHIVDAVLYLEGEPFSDLRLLRCVKNRFGSTNEVGIFEMKNNGLVEVADPSRLFLSQRHGPRVGSIIVPTIEGSRPLMAEIQALTNPTSFGLPRRTANGIDFGRLLLVTAVLSRRAGVRLSNQDIIVNVTGGLRVDEPSADLGIALAIASSYRDAEVEKGLIAVGEVSLSGELRPVSQIERRIGEAARLGFKRCLLPGAGGVCLHATFRDMETITVNSLKEALRIGLAKKAGQ